MNTSYRLQLRLLSDTTFGRGDGVAGLVDAEVQHDTLGMPFLGGRSLKGLLGAECADIVYALEPDDSTEMGRWRVTEYRLFGDIGSALQGAANLRIGPAELPADLRAAIAEDIDKERVTSQEVLESLTALRRQTSMDALSGAPKQETLRTMRVIIRETILEAVISFMEPPTSDELFLLGACVKALRRGGTGRNRGRGRLIAKLFNSDAIDVTNELFSGFQVAVGV